jgi:hypothetical protein
MILDVTKFNLNEIKNNVLREYANTYVEIYADFMQQVLQMGLEIEAEDTTDAVSQKFEDLHKKNAVARNSDKSIYTNRISPAVSVVAFPAKWVDQRWKKSLPGRR